VLIINEAYSSNLGDQAINEGMQNLFKVLNFETHFCYFSNPVLKKLPGYNYTNPPKAAAAKGFIAALKKYTRPFFMLYVYARYYYRLTKQVKSVLKNNHYDMVVIGGGQLINSSAKQKISFFALALFIWVKQAKRLTGIPLYLIGIGVVSRFHAMEKYLYKKALDNVKAVWVRDKFSQKSLADIFKKPADVIPDIAFFENEYTATPQKSNLALVGIYSYDEYSKKFDVQQTNKEAYYEYWKNKVETFLKQGKTVNLFYTTITDAYETVLFSQYLQKQKMDIPVAPVNSLPDLNKLLQQAGFVYTARMHALILGLKKGCEVQPYLISQKLQSFADEYIDSDAQPAVLSNLLYQTFKTVFNGDDVA
jgi:polysaccharide pyruvyl transferase WcaK-like protein